VRRHGRKEGARRLLSCCVQQCSASKPGCDGGCGCGCGASLLPVRMLMLMVPSRVNANSNCTRRRPQSPAVVSGSLCARERVGPLSVEPSAASRIWIHSSTTQALPALLLLLLLLL